MLLTVVAFAFLIFTWVGVDLLLPTAHGVPPAGATPGAGEGDMRLLAVGVDHHSAPTSVREALAFEGPRRDEGLDALLAAFPGVEFVIVSTCNRVELYAASTAATTTARGRRPRRFPG